MLWSGFAWADDLADEADLHFKIANERYTSQDFRGALEHFLTSNRLVPNRNVIFNIARTYEQLKEYPDAFRYYVQALDLEKDPSSRQRIEQFIQQIRPNVAVISVVTDPPGATVYINRRDLGPRGDTPRLLGFPAGTYKVIVERDGYEPAELANVEAKLGEQQSVSLKLAPIVGITHLVGEPKGASVRVDDPTSSPACLIPCDLTLPPGKHRLYVSKQGFQKTEQDVNVLARAEISAQIRLDPLSGSLIVNVDESDALVEVDGKPVGYAPLVLPVQSGKRRLRVSRIGYRTVEQSVNVPANEQTRVQISLRQVEEVEAASRNTEAVEDAPGSVTIIPYQELRAMGYPTIVEALRGVRGLYVSDDTSYGYVGFRGIQIPGDFNNRVLVLLNGQPMNDNWTALSYVDTAARTNLEDVERIEIVRGPGSVLYGTGAFSGLINVVTRGRPSKVSAGLGAGLYGNSVLHAHGTTQLPFGKNYGLWVSVSAGRGLGRDYFFPELVSSSFDGYSRNADDVNMGTIEGRIWAKDVSVQAFVHTRRKTMPAGVVGTAVGDDRTRFREIRGFVEVKYEPQISRQLGSMTRVSLNHFGFQGSFWYDPLPELGYSQISTEEIFHGWWLIGEQRVVVTPTSNVRITAGVEGQLHLVASQRGEETDCYIDDGCSSYLYLPSSAETYDDNTFDEQPFQIVAPYILADLNPSPKVRLSAGARLDYYHYRDFGFSSVSPRLAVILRPYDQGDLKILGGRAFRAPTVFEQFYTTLNWETPKDQLKPETIWSGELEYTHRISTTLSALGTVYVNYLDNLVAQRGSQIEGDPTYYANTNVPILVLGGSAELRREWRQGWMASVTYSYARARYLQDDPQQLRQVPNAPEHMASFRGALPLVPKSLTLASRLTVETPRFDSHTATDDPIAQTSTEPAVIWDIVLSGQAEAFDLHYNFGVYNAADWRYTAPVSPDFPVSKVPQNGRTFLASAKVNF